MADTPGHGEVVEDALNRRGDDVILAHLPEAGIHGNRHFTFSDVNNLQIAETSCPNFWKRRVWTNLR